MYEYVCKSCGGKQYSASGTKTNEPCIYCGETELAISDYVTLEEILEMNDGTNE